MCARVPTRAVIVGAAVLFAGLAACQGAPTAAPSGQSASAAAAASTAAGSPNAPSAAAAASPDVGAPCAPKTVPFDAKNFDLTGPWADDEGGIYYLRQIGKVVWWNGMSSRAGPAVALGRDWNNVGRGVITDLTIAVDWSSVPRASELGAGTVTLSIGKDSSGNIQLTTTAWTGSHWGSGLTPCAPG